MSDIYNSNNANFLLGILMNDCTKILDNKYNFDKSDFEPKLFQKIIYATIHNLAINGVKEVDFIDIEEFLNNYPTQQRVYEDNDGTEFCKTIKELSKDKVSNIDYYYQDIKKHSLLRAYQNNGFDISEIWDIEKSDTTNEEELNNWSMGDICKHFDKLQLDIKKEFCTDNSIEEVKLGSWFYDIKESFKQDPMFGASLFSEYLNTATRGWIKGQMIVGSMPSGTGKSTISVCVACMIGCKELYNYETNKFEKNPCYIENSGAMYIQYEMQSRTEITPKFVAYISGVPCNHILNGYYEEGEEERVDYAIKLLDDSNIHIVTMTVLSLGTLNNYVKEYKLTHNCDYVIYDYIFDSASINSEIATKNKIATRSDMILSTISSTLKDIAVENDVGVLTFTQTNAHIETEEDLGANVISGSRAIQNKADVGLIMHPLTRKENKVVDEIMLQNSERSDFKIVRPNRVINLYKIRFGAIEKDTKVWINLDLSTGRVKDCFCTNYKNEPYKIKKTKLEYY